MKKDKEVEPLATSSNTNPKVNKFDSGDDEDSSSKNGHRIFSSPQFSPRNASSKYDFVKVLSSFYFPSLSLVFDSILLFIWLSSKSINIFLVEKSTTMLTELTELDFRRNPSPQILFL